MLAEEQRSGLRQFFAASRGIVAAYVFGSHARGKAGPMSDLDLAVLLEDGFAPRAKLDLLADLAENGYCSVDLTVLNDASPLLRYEIVGPNQLVYARQDFDRAAYLARAVMEYLDFSPFLATQRAYLKYKLTRGE